MAQIQLFVDAERAYLRWLAVHPNGFVVNTLRALPANYMVLHRASCPSISRYAKGARPGGFTEHQYVKVTSETAAELSAWAGDHGRPDGSFSAICSMCKPV